MTISTWQSQWTEGQYISDFVYKNFYDDFKQTPLYQDSSSALETSDTVTLSFCTSYVLTAIKFNEKMPINPMKNIFCCIKMIFLSIFYLITYK